MAQGLVLAIRIYRLFFHAVTRNHCRFYPSCSAYAIEAIQCLGWKQGGWAAFRRILRCHPWHPGGVDLLYHMHSRDSRLCGNDTPTHRDSMHRNKSNNPIAQASGHPIHPQPTLSCN